MMKKRYLQAVIIVMTALMMTGCGTKFPDLTEEQYKQTVEYAAGLLMKYSNNGQERLVVVDAKEVLKERQKEAARAAEIELAKEQAAKNSQKDQAPAQVQEPEPALEETEPEGQELTTDPDAMTEGTEATEGDSSEEATEVSDPNAITLSSDESQEIMPDIFLSYQGYSVSSTYPESSKSYVVNADKSKRLLVLRFDLYNGSDTEKSVNLIPLGLSFKIILNGKDIGYSSVTFLPNDLSSYSGNIDSRAHESVVVLTQISEKEATKIENLGMIVTIKGETQTVVLK